MSIDTKRTKRFKRYGIMPSMQPKIVVHSDDPSRLTVEIYRFVPFPRSKLLKRSFVSWNAIAKHLGFQLWYAGFKILNAFVERKCRDGYRPELVSILRQGPNRCIPARVRIHDRGGGDWQKELKYHKIALEAVTYLPEQRLDKVLHTTMARTPLLRVPGGYSRCHMAMFPQPLLFTLLPGRKFKKQYAPVELIYDAEGAWSRHYEIIYDLTQAFEPMTGRPLTVPFTAEHISEISLAK